MVSPALRASKVAALAWAFYAALGAGIPARADLWPLRHEPRALTGTFMEPRSAHYHSGVDLRTGGRSGIEVQAPVDGWIQRLRTSPEGYGKAIYLRADDGRSYVFAHLSAFAVPLQERITAEWTRTRRYETDLSLPADALRVRAGELIALSGSTGTGAPHLHVEIRDAAGRPVNPLLNGLEFADDVAPVIEAIRIVALSPESVLAEGALLQELREDGLLTASGPIGFEVRCADYAPNAPFALMPHAIELYQDGELVVSMLQDRFDFADSGQMRLEIERTPDARWIRLHPRAGNRLPGRRLRSFQEATTRSDFQLVVRDAAGNRSSRSFQLDAIRAKPIDGIVEARLRFAGSFLELAGPADWRMLDAQGARELPGMLHRIPYAELRASRIDFELQGEPEARFELRGWVPGWQGEHDVANVYVARDPGDAFFPGGFLEWAPLELPGELPAAAEVLGPVYELRPHGIAFDDALQLRPLRELPADAGLFLRDRRGEWELLERDGAAWLLDDHGVLAILRDQRAPQLGPWRDEDGQQLRDGQRLQRRGARSDGIGAPLWPSVLLPLADDLAGFDPAGLDARLDAEPWPARWDPEDEFVAFDFFVDPGAGEHLLELTATDRLGNAASARLRIELLPD